MEVEKKRDTSQNNHLEFVVEKAQFLSFFFFFPSLILVVIIVNSDFYFILFAYFYLRRVKMMTKKFLDLCCLQQWFLNLPLSEPAEVLCKSFKPLKMSIFFFCFK